MAWTTNYYQHDTVGTTRQLTDKSQNVTDTYLYDAFGTEVSKAGTTENPFRWIGREGYYYDTATGNSYVRARNYDPVTARWMSLDPIGFSSNTMNLYCYVDNQPIDKIDPRGLYVFKHAPNRPEYECSNGAKDCINLAFSEILTILDNHSAANDCFNPSFPRSPRCPTCRAQLADCVKATLGGPIQIWCDPQVKPRDSASSYGQCIRSKDRATGKDHSKVPPDKTCEACSPGLLIDSFIRINTDSQVWKGVKKPCTKASPGFKELVRLLVHETLHNCVGGQHGGADSKDRPGADTASVDFMNNCWK